MSARAEHRARRSREQSERLSRLVDAWLTRRGVEDRWPDGRYRGQHETQLRELRTRLLGAARVLDGTLDQLSASMPDSAVYAACQRHDRSLVWLERVWQYFAEKFDQRRAEGALDPEVGALLRAADEVVWSCQAPVMALAGREATAPLAHLEPQFSPAAVELDRPLPAGLARPADVESFERLLDTIPVPVVSLPPWCVGAAWWLTHLAHEVGHHVQRALGVTAPFRRELRAVAERGGLGADDAAYWGSCGDEVFADVVAVLLLGPAGVHATREVELTDAGAMRVRRSGRGATYLSVAVRLHLLATVADRVGLDGEAMIEVPGLDWRALVDGTPESSRDAALVPRVVDAALGPLPGLPLPLPALCGALEEHGAWSLPAFAPGGAVDLWRSELLGPGGVPVLPEQQRRVETGRWIAAAALLAWVDLTGSARTSPDELARLSQRTQEALVGNSPPGVRAGGPTTGDTGGSLAAGLLALADAVPDVGVPAPSGAQAPLRPHGEPAP